MADFRTSYSTGVGVGQGLNPVVTLVGDWDKALVVIGNLDAAVLEGAMEGQLAAGKKIMETVKANIRKGGPEGVHWPDYSALYKARKAKLGGNTDKKWRLTDTYYDAITVSTKGMGVVVGVPKNARGRVNKTNPLTLGQIAKILETGSHLYNIQARPLWAPSFRQFGGKARVAYHITYHIRKNLFLLSNMRGTKISFK